MMIIMHDGYVMIMLFNVVLVMGGVMALGIGLRGRRMDDHPLCRKCGFDLFGLPEGVTQCSECGTDVSRPGAVKIGHHQRRTGLVILGLSLLVPAVLWTISIVWISARQVDLNPYKPVWWLLGDATRGSTPTRDAALKELVRRVQNNQLSPAQLQDILDRALKLQGDTTRPWVIGWGDLVETAQVAGKLKPEIWQQYLKQAVTGFRLEARPKVRRGAPLPLRLVQGPMRVGSTQLWVNYKYDGMMINDLPCEHNHSGGGGTQLSARGSGSSSWAVPSDDPALAGLNLGPQTVGLKLNLKVYNSPNPPPGPGDGTPAVETELELKANWELVDEPTVRVVNDPSLRQAVEKALKVRITNLQTAGDSRYAYASVNLDVQSPPVGLAYEVLLRDGDKQWSAGHVAFEAHKGHSWGLSPPASKLQTDRVDVVLRPSLYAAERHVYQNEMWDGEVVFRDVEVVRER